MVKKKAKNVSVKDIKVEVIRIIACFSVIWYHIRSLPFKSNGELSETAVFFECVCTICVMTFFFISGFFIYDKKGNIFIDWFKLILSFIKRVFIPFILVVIFTIIFHNFLISTDTFMGCIEKFDFSAIWWTIYFSFKEFTANYLPGTAAHLWYIYSYMLIIALYPVTRFILKELPRAVSYAIAIIFLILMIINDYTLYIDYPIINNFFDIVHKPIFYSLFGSLLYNDFIKKFFINKNVKKKPFILYKPLFFILIIVYIITFVFLFKTQCSYDLNVNKSYVYTSWLSTFSVVMTTVFILMIYNLDIDRFFTPKVTKAICYIADKTLGVYLVHYLIITKLLSIGVQSLFNTNLSYLPQHFLYFIVYSMIIFLLSIIIVILAEKFIKLFTYRRKEND